MDVNLLPTCDMCQQHIFQGSLLYHCTACSLDPGFDACQKCYGPDVHKVHQSYIEGGVYPAFNPYVNICRLCQLPRVDQNAKNRVPVVNRLDVIRTQLGLDATQDGPELAKFICKSCDNRLWRLKKDQAPPMTVPQFRKSSRQSKKGRRQSQDIVLIDNDDVQILQSIENKQSEGMGLVSATQSVPFETSNSLTSGPCAPHRGTYQDVQLVPSLELQRPKLSEALQKSYFSKPVDPNPFFRKDSAHKFLGKSKKANKKLSSDLKNVNVISITDSEEESDCRIDSRCGAVAETSSDEEYDYQCLGTVSLVRKVGTEILEFVYDEVVVKVASNKEGVASEKLHEVGIVEIDSNDLEIDLDETGTADEDTSIVETTEANENTPVGKERGTFTRNVFESFKNFVEESSKGEESSSVVQDITHGGNKAIETDEKTARSSTNGQRNENTEQQITIVDIVSQSLNIGDTFSADLFCRKLSAANDKKQVPNSSDIGNENDKQNENVSTGENHSEENRNSEIRENTTSCNPVIKPGNASLGVENKSVESNIIQPIVIQPILEPSPSSAADCSVAQPAAKRMKLTPQNQIPQNTRHLPEMLGTDNKHIRSDNLFDAVDGARHSATLQTVFPSTTISMQKNPNAFSQMTAVPFPEQQVQQSKQQGYRCKICRQDLYGAVVDFHKHVRTHTGERPWSCATCLITFNLSKSLRQHIQEYGHRSGAVTFGHGLLEILEQKFPNELDTEEKLLIGELASESNSRKEIHSCAMCDQTFYYTEELRQHELSHIPQMSSYPCTMCQTRLPNVAALQDHVNQMHNVDHILFCSLCKIGFLHVSQYNMHHERKHTSKPNLQNKASFESNKVIHNTFSQQIPLSTPQHPSPGYQPSIVGHNSRKTNTMTSTASHIPQGQYAPYGHNMQGKSTKNNRGYQPQSPAYQHSQVPRNRPANNAMSFNQWQYPHFTATANQPTGANVQYTHRQPLQSTPQGLQPSWQQMPVMPLLGVQDNTNVAQITHQLYPSQQSAGYNITGNSYNQSYQYL